MLPSLQLCHSWLIVPQLTHLLLHFQHSSTQHFNFLQLFFRFLWPRRSGNPRISISSSTLLDEQGTGQAFGQTGKIWKTPQLFFRMGVKTQFAQFAASIIIEAAHCGLVELVRRPKFIEAVSKTAILLITALCCEESLAHGGLP